MVLLIDDDPRFLEQAEVELRKAGYRVLLATTGAQAMDLMARVGEEVRLIMVDLDLPKVPGIDVIEHMRSAFPDIPIIAFSGVVQNDVLEVAKYLGAAAALRKPISAEWANVVRKVKERGAGS